MTLQRTPISVSELYRRIETNTDLTRCNGCDDCGLRCTAGVPMSREEYRAVREYIAAPGIRDEADMVAASPRTVDMGDDVTYESCRFRNRQTGRCVIYPVRPLVCRLLGHVEWMPCPTASVPGRIPTPVALEILRDYAESPRHTYEEWRGLDAGNG